MNPIFFDTPADLRKWFLEHHAKDKEIWIGFYLKKSGIKAVTYKEAVDMALAFGWIDGIRKTYDEQSYTNRFTPRTAKSIWSKVNITRVKELTDSGFMHESGLEVFKNRDLKMANLYSFEQKNLAFTKEQKEEFTKHKKAWEFFEKQAPSYKKPAIWWVVGAKQEETKVKRLKILIENSENGEKIPHLRPRVRGKK